MTSQYRIGDSVQITEGINKGASGTVMDEAISGGVHLYLVDRNGASSWVSGEHLEAAPPRAS